jgi:proline racemase
VTVVDSHAGGEPFRVVIGGLPDIPGGTVLERRSYAIANLDELRRALMWEPRGHADMYGGWLGPPVNPGSDLSVLFLHNEGFSTMCGHGIIALVKVVLDTGILDREGDKPRVVIDTPAGVVAACAVRSGGSVSTVSFRNVPSFVAALDEEVVVPGVGSIRYDLAFGGAFYAYVDQTHLGLDGTDAGAYIEMGRTIKAAVIASRPVEHPVEPDLGFLYGVIFTGPPSDDTNHSRHVCVFADGEVDRSPTGTGVSGRLAILHARGQVGVGEPIRVESIVGSVFEGSVAETTDFAGLPAVIPEVSGTAYIIGRSEFWFDPEDGLGRGFLLR